MSAALSILEYHSVNTAPRGEHRPFLHIHPARLHQQILLLRALGVRGLSVSEALRHWRESRPGRVVALTFDDAYEDVFHNALPLLRAAGFTATTYAVSACVGAFNRWDAEVIGARKQTMTHAQLLAWRDAGMEIGAHTRTHPRLTTCADAQLEDELHGSKYDLETLLGDPITQLCYPYGDTDERVVAVARAAGFDAAVTTRRGRVRTSDNELLLPRLSVRGDVPLLLFPFRILTRYADRRRK